MSTRYNGNPVATDVQPKPATPRQLRCQFSLRSILLITFVLAFLLGIEAYISDGAVAPGALVWVTFMLVWSMAVPLFMLHASRTLKSFALGFAMGAGIESLTLYLLIDSNNLQLSSNGVPLGWWPVCLPCYRIATRLGYAQIGDVWPYFLGMGVSGCAGGVVVFVVRRGAKTWLWRKSTASKPCCHADSCSDTKRLPQQPASGPPNS